MSSLNRRQFMQACATHRQKSGRWQRRLHEPARKHARLRRARMQGLREFEVFRTVKPGNARQHHGEPGEKERRAERTPFLRIRRSRANQLREPGFERAIDDDWPQSVRARTRRAVADFERGTGGLRERPEGREIAGRSRPEPAQRLLGYAGSAGPFSVGPAFATRTGRQLRKQRGEGVG